MEITQQQDSVLTAVFGQLFNITTKPTLYILYQISTIRFGMLHTNLRENFVYLFKTVSFLQGRYILCNFEAINDLMSKYLYSYNITFHYMFRALLCSSSGQIVYVQHLVQSFSMSGHTLHWLSSVLTGVTYGRS